MKKLIITAALVVAGAAMAATTASAQSFSDGDLLLLFRVNDGSGTGASQDLEVDLGSAYNFTPTTTTETVITVSTDLENIYGNGSTNASWNGRSDLVFSLASADTTNANFWISDPGNANTVTVNSPQATNGALEGQISQLQNEQSGTAGSASGAYKVTVASGDPYNYSDVIRDVDSNQGGPPGPFTTDYNGMPFSTEQGVSASGSTIELYLQSPGTGRNPVATSTDIGIFTLTSTGNLTFTGADLEGGSVPEPSVFMFLGFGALLLMIVYRRRAFAC